MAAVSPALLVHSLRGKLLYSCCRFFIALRQFLKTEDWFFLLAFFQEESNAFQECNNVSTFIICSYLCHHSIIIVHKRLRIVSLLDSSELK